MATGSTTNIAAAVAMPIQCTLSGPGTYTATLTMSGLTGSAVGTASTASAALTQATGQLLVLLAQLANSTSAPPLMGTSSAQQWAMYAFNIAYNDYTNQGGT